MQYTIESEATNDERHGIQFDLPNGYEIHLWMDSERTLLIKKLRQHITVLQLEDQVGLPQKRKKRGNSKILEKTI